MEESRIEKILSNNKKEIFLALSSLGISAVDVTYNGSGDSGSIDEIYFYDKKDDLVDICKISDKEPLVSNIKRVPSRWGHNEEENDDNSTTVRLFDAIENFCYDTLEINVGGWEINAGGNGKFSFSVPKKKILWTHTELIEQSETKNI